MPIQARARRRRSATLIDFHSGENQFKVDYGPPHCANVFSPSYRVAKRMLPRLGEFCSCCCFCLNLPRAFSQPVATTYRRRTGIGRRNGIEIGYKTLKDRGYYCMFDRRRVPCNTCIYLRLGRRDRCQTGLKYFSCRGRKDGLVGGLRKSSPGVRLEKCLLSWVS